MANEQFQIHDFLRFNPDWVKDEVPPWLLVAFDKNILRDLALVSLERSRAVNELNNKAIDKAMDIVKRAKF